MFLQLFKGLTAPKPVVILRVAHEPFGVLAVQFQKLRYRHPHEIVHLARLRHQMAGLFVGKRYFVCIVIFVVEISAIVQDTFVNRFKEIFQVLWIFMDAQLLFQFSDGGVPAGVASRDMSRTTCVQKVRVVLLQVAAKLEKYTARSVKGPYMDRAVPKPFGMNLRSPARIPRRAAVRVQDVDLFFHRGKYRLSSSSSRRRGSACIIPADSRLRRHDNEREQGLSAIVNRLEGACQKCQGSVPVDGHLVGSVAAAVIQVGQGRFVGSSVVRALPMLLAF